LVEHKERSRLSQETEETKAKEVMKTSVKRTTWKRKLTEGKGGKKQKKGGKNVVHISQTHTSNTEKLSEARNFRFRCLRTQYQEHLQGKWEHLLAFKIILSSLSLIFVLLF
jgi:hypothetical protein